MAKIDEFGDFVYPLVPKKLWPAVSFACDMLQQGRGFNLAIERASNYYKVDPDEVKKHVVDRIQAGRRHKNPKEIKPKLPRMLKMPQGYCKDCEFCRVNNKQIQDVLTSLRNKAVEIEKGIDEIYSDETKTKNARTSAAKNLAREKMGLRYYHSLTDRLSVTKPDEVSANMFFEAMRAETVREIVCTRHAQARIKGALCELAFPVIPEDKVFNGSIGCGEFEARKND